MAATAAITAMATTTATELAPPTAPHRPGGKRGSGPDRLTVVLLAIAAFLLVLALLASQLRPTVTVASRRPVVVLRRIYETKVVETVPGASGANGTSVSQSVSGSTPADAAAAPTTRSS